MYSLNYDMVVQVLQQFNYTGEVHARVSTHAAMKGGGRVVLVVKRGVVVALAVFDNKGQKLYQEAEAYNLLLKLGVLDWELVPLTPSQPATRISAPPATPSIYVDARSIPYRLAVSPQQMRMWSALHRSVYSLSNGARSSEQIAIFLASPLNSVMQALHDLVKISAIEIKGSKDQ